MRFFLVSSSLLLLGKLASAGNSPLLSPYVLHEKRSLVPKGWSPSRKHHPSAVLPLRFALTQSNIDTIGDLLEDVANPGSPNYGKHWTPSRIASTFAPTDESINTVSDWLFENGFAVDRVRLSPTRGWIEVNVTVEEAEDLLLAEYHVYQHHSGTQHVGCESYHLPAHITPHVDFITPTVHFDAILGKRAEPARDVGQPNEGTTPKTTGMVQNLFNDLDNCDSQITPDCLRALYGLVYEPMSTKKNSFGIVEYTPQALVKSDLTLFFQTFSPTQVGTSPILSSIDGGVLQTTNTGFQFNGESDLDIEYGMALVGRKQPVVLYQVGDLVEGASFNNFLDAIDGSYCQFQGGDDPTQDGIYPDNQPGGFTGAAQCGTVKPANVISTSYSYNEADLTPFYTARQCAEYAKLGLMGVTVLYSSGDNGVAGNSNLCLNPDGSQSTTGTIFNPSFPGTCPYITSIGATQVNPGSTVDQPESACEQVIFSGGGFSNRFPVPSYQKTAVGGYFKAHKPNIPPSKYNSTGRGFPDMSANGANYVVAVNGEFFLVYGTSASTPVVGAILTQVNDARISAGKQPLGFINPTIYSSNFKDAFNDITSGSNPGCGTNGFTAVSGWDPVTGLGTPNFPRLLSKWLSLP